MPIGPEPTLPGVGGQNYAPGEQLVANVLNRVFMTILAIGGMAFGAMQAIGAPFIDRFRQLSFQHDPTTAIDPALAADAVQRGVYPGQDWAGEARLGGFTKERFEALVELSGNPPGPGELLARWRFGAIDDAALEHGIRQGRIKNEWLQFYRDQRHLPISIGEAVTAAVQNHLSRAEAENIADGQGVDPAGFNILYENAGRPLSMTEMVQLWRRGIVDQAAVEQAIRESDLKDKYIGPALHLFDYLPPPRTITTLLSHGAITQAQANDLFRKAGLSPELAAAYTTSASHIKTAAHKELATSQVTGLYVDKLLDRAGAVEDLAKIGYATAEANLVLDLADLRARDKLRAQAAAKIRTLFVSKKIDSAGAQSDLAKVGLDAGQIAELMPLWEIEQSSPSKQLTEAQLVAAFKAGVIDTATLAVRISGLGYDQADTAILVALAGPAPTPTGA